MYTFDLVSSGDRRHCMTRDLRTCRVAVFRSLENIMTVSLGGESSCDPVSKEYEDEEYIDEYEDEDEEYIY